MSNLSYDEKNTLNTLIGVLPCNFCCTPLHASCLLGHPGILAEDKLLAGQNCVLSGCRVRLNEKLITY